MGVIGWLLFGGLVGWLASKLMGTDAQQGIFLNIIVGIIGAVIGGRLATRLAELVRPNWVTTALSLEAALLVVATLAAINFRDSSGSLFQSYSIIVLTALAMGIRNATVRKLAIPDLTTTVLTLTVTGLAADSTLAGGTSPRWRRRLLAVLLMFFGAAIGTLLLRRSLALPLATATLLSICCVALSLKQRVVLETRASNIK